MHLLKSGSEPSASRIGPDMNAFVRRSVCPIMVLDRDFRFVLANEAYQKAVRISEAELLGRSYFDVFPVSPEREREIADTFRRTLDGEPTTLEVQPVADGAEKAGGAGRHWQAMLEPLSNAAGEAEFIVQRAQDVTAQVMLQRSHDVIAAELDHRVKNLVSVILATARITSAGAESVEQYTEEFCGRLESMARLYHKMSARGWKGLSLREILEDELGSVAGRGVSEYSLEGEDIILSLKASKDGGMIIHELAANAVKHGCFSRRGGRLDVEWSIAGGMLRVVWAESSLQGVKAPEKTGFGTKLMTMMPNARVRREYRDTGLWLEFMVPVDLAVDGYEFVAGEAG